MAKAFPGFSPKAISFLRQLEKNNSRDWFQPRKDLFEAIVRQPMIELVSLMCDDLREFAVDHVTEPGKALYRIHRDTRFSKDKSPYKPHIAAQFPRAGLPRHAGAGYFFSVSHKGIEVAGGMYMPGPEELAAVRQAIARDEKKFRALLASKTILRLLGPLQGTQLVRTPKGFAADHPAEDLLRRKQLYFYMVLEPKIALGTSLKKQVIDRFRAMKPVVEFLNAAALAARKAEESKADRPMRPEPMF